MRGFRLIGAASAVALIAAACGGGASQAGGEPIDVPAAVEAEQSGPAVEGAAVDPVEVQITVSEFAIAAETTTFKVGIPYRFVVTNLGAIAHEVMLIPGVDVSSGNMDEMDEMALGMVDAAELTPGATVAFDVTFAEPGAAGTLELSCHLPGHYEAGMMLPIVIEA
jgi:uncharacterized cupredoxin-like copper-binding protein